MYSSPLELGITYCKIFLNKRIVIFVLRAHSLQHKSNALPGEHYPYRNHCTAIQTSVKYRFLWCANWKQIPLRCIILACGSAGNYKCITKGKKVAYFTISTPRQTNGNVCISSCKLMWLVCRFGFLLALMPPTKRISHHTRLILIANRNYRKILP